MSEIAQLKPQIATKQRISRITARLRRGLLEMAEDKSLSPRERLSAYTKLLNSIKLAPERARKVRSDKKIHQRGLDAILKQVNAA